MQPGRVDLVAFQIGFEFRGGMEDALAQSGRTEPQRTGDGGGDRAGRQRAPPAELPPAEHKNQDRRDNKNSAAGDDKTDVGEKQRGKTEEREHDAPSALAPVIAGRADKPEGADQENAALPDVIFDRHPILLGVTGQAGDQCERP